jgi:hypothetical protein
VCKKVVWVINRTGQSTLKDYVPEKIYQQGLNGGSSSEKAFRPNLKGLIIIGTRYMAHINKNERIQGEKLYPREAKAIFLYHKENHDHVV